MKRTKQLQTVVDKTNEYLRNNKIKDQGDSAFMVVQWALLETHTYQGFNYYKEIETTSWDGIKRKMPILACTDDPEKFDYLQLY